MRSFVLLFIVFSVTIAAYAQVTITPLPVPPLPIPLPPVFSGYSSSVVDHIGNVLIFDNSYPLLLSGVGGAPVTPSPTKTHVTVISSDGQTQNRYDYDGSMQILGVGDKAVYAFVNTFVPTMASPIGRTISRRLVALHVVAGTLPATLPSIDLSGNEDVKLSAGSAIDGTDTIATIQSLFPPFVAGPTAPANTIHTVRLFTCDGTSFAPNLKNPISTMP
jgi:hypothetical protein